MSVLNYKEVATKNHLLYAFSDEIEEKTSSHILVTKAKYQQQAKFWSVVTL
jgi:hypothetical protein